MVFRKFGWISRKIHAISFKTMHCARECSRMFLSLCLSKLQKAMSVLCFGKSLQDSFWPLQLDWCRYSCCTLSFTLPRIAGIATAEIAASSKLIAVAKLCFSNTSNISIIHFQRSYSFSSRVLTTDFDNFKLHMFSAYSWLHWWLLSWT